MSATRTAQMNVASLGYVWDTETLDWVAATQAEAGVGGGDASAANQSTEITRLTSILAQLDVALSTRAAESGGNLATIAGKDFATQTTLLLVKTALDSLLTELQLKADLLETQPVSLASIPIHASAATSAKQDTGNTSIASVDTKTPALGQALAAASTPVVLTAAQIATLTPPAALVGFALEAGNLASILAKLITAPATEAKQDAIVTALNLLATAALQTTGNASLVSIDTSTGRLPVAQGTLNASSIYGTLNQGLVSDAPESYTPGYIEPLSVTSEGRLRVSAVAADIDRAWQHTFDSPWADQSAWAGNPYE